MAENDSHFLRGEQRLFKRVVPHLAPLSAPLLLRVYPRIRMRDQRAHVVQPARSRSRVRARRRSGSRRRRGRHRRAPRRPTSPNRRARRRRRARPRARAHGAQSRTLSSRRRATRPPLHLRLRGMFLDRRAVRVQRRDRGGLRDGRRARARSRPSAARRMRVVQPLHARVAPERIRGARGQLCAGPGERERRVRGEDVFVERREGGGRGRREGLRGGGVRVDSQVGPGALHVVI